MTKADFIKQCSLKKEFKSCPYWALCLAEKKVEYTDLTEEELNAIQKQKYENLKF